MSDIWTRARCDARDLRRRLMGDNPADADAIVIAALADAELTVCAVPPTDALLAGSHAVLDREIGAVWLRTGVPTATAAYLIAHELAHFHLHLDYTASQEYEGATDGDTPGESGAFLIGYGPRERRETEANAWAQELLLPAQVARAAFFDGGESAAQIAARFGVPLAVVLQQLQTPALPDTPVCESDIPEPLPLDSSQHAAATTDSCPLLLGAGPGTGKTRTLVARVKHLTKTGIAPETILVLTFSRKATAELRERLQKHLPPSVARRVPVCTFHAFGYDLLRRYHRYTDLPPNPALLGDAEAFALMESRLTACISDPLWFPHDPLFPLRDCLRLLGRLKEELVTPAEAAQRAAASGDPKQQNLAAIYAAYEAALRETQCLDSADLVCRAVSLLAENPAVRLREQSRWAHLLVDEYQDTNRAGAKLVQLLGGNGTGVWCVGDLRQAIYRFRGASPANVTRFETDFPDGTRQDLAVNYRSRRSLVSCFGQLAEGSGDLWQTNRAEEIGDPCITLAIAETESLQSHGIANEIKRMRGSNLRYDWRDFAVLCRTNTQATTIRAALVMQNIPATGNPEPLAWLRDKTVRELLLLLSLTGKSGALAARTGCILPRTLRGKTHPADFFNEALYGESGLARTTSTPRALQTLLALAQGFAAPDGNRDTNAAFLSHVRRVARMGQAPRTAHDAEPGDAPDAVQVLTIHAAKGLEFGVVFVPNLSQGRFPPNPRPGIFTDTDAATLLGTADDDSDEEARLLFVAVTRARDYLFLSLAEKYDNRAAQPSPLLAPFAAMPEVTTVRWATGAPPAPPAVPATPDPKPSDTPTLAHQLDAYGRCPRRYFYETVQDLRDTRTRTAYDHFKAEVRALLRDTEKSPEPDPADPWRNAYRAEADRIAARSPANAKLAPAPAYRIELPEGTVEIRPDGIAHDGAVTRITFAKKKETGQSDAPNTLLFTAAPEGTAVRVRHIRTGEERAIEPTTNASTRRARESHLAAYNRALRGIRLQVFPPTPVDKNDCADCAYLLICE